MRLTKKLTEKEFLSYGKIIWRTTDKSDDTQYIYNIYPEEEQTTVEEYWKRTYNENGNYHQAGGHESNMIDTDGILEQINNAIERGEDVTGFKTGKPPKRLHGMPTICAKKMIGKIPNYEKNLKRIF